MASFADWSDNPGTIIHICVNGPRKLWYGIQAVRYRAVNSTGLERCVDDVPDNQREPYPYLMEPCECEGCEEEWDFQKRINYVPNLR